MSTDEELRDIKDKDTLLTTNPVPERDEDVSDAQSQIIASLRAQVTDLFTQVTQLNSKLVSSYDRVSDLEDQLHEASSSLRSASIAVSSLELERSEYLSALNTGLLVEKSHVTAELNRLMERATEEAAQRGQAESARRDIERELDDLSATLFDQANTMVAEARLNQARSERKVREAEEALRGAEEAVRMMQVQMQSLESDKLAAEREVMTARVTMGKGKWVEPDNPRTNTHEMRFLTTHTPYAEFTAFIAHLRTLRSSQPAPPSISSLLNQPFLARLITEDSEPTVRLDLAPSLNWLSRRSVLAAIHTSMLKVQPMSFLGFLQELGSQLQSWQAIPCALCGKHVASLPSTSAHEKPASYTLAAFTRSSSSKPKSWFNYTLALSSATNVNATADSCSGEQELPENIYVFRIAGPSPSQPPSPLSPMHSKMASSPSAPSSSRTSIHLPATSRKPPSQSHHPPYPLCTSNYCLFRLRTTCSLWAFVRTGIVEQVWNEEILQPPRSASVDKHTIDECGSPKQLPIPLESQPNSPNTSEKPPVPPRRRRLWEVASALSEKAVNWRKDSAESTQGRENEVKKELPPPPPSHSPTHESHVNISVPQPQAAPPLPRRNELRGPSSRRGSIGEIPSSGVEITDRVTTANDVHDSEQRKRNSSVESFTTPTDEVDLSAIQAGNKATTDVSMEQVSILPETQRAPSSHDSHPQTPVSLPARPPSRVDSPQPPPCPSTGSPALHHTVPLPPSRTSSPAPPVPRRAPARRAAPVPPSTSNTIAVSQRPNTPGNSDSTLVMASDGSVLVNNPQVPKQDAQAAVDSLVVGTTAPDGAVGSNEEPVIAPPLDAPRNVDDQVTPDGCAVAATIRGPVTDSSAQPAAAAPHMPPAESHRLSKTISEAEGVCTDGSSIDARAATSTLPEKDSARSSTENEKCVDPGTKLTSTDAQIFASDATWEERTWKEVARLREEMFWARVGSLREV